MTNVQRSASRALPLIHAAFAAVAQARRASNPRPHRVPMAQKVHEVVHNLYEKRQRKVKLLSAKTMALLDLVKL